MNFKAISTIVALVAVSSLAQINLLAPSITFRDNNTAANTTVHFGDLSLAGGHAGDNWGWLYAERIISRVLGMHITGYSVVVGDLDVVGNFSVTGTKNFLQLHPTDTTKVIKYSCIESGEVLTLVRGSAKTSYGTAKIDLPEHFGLVTSDDVPVTVLLTPENFPVLLYTASKSKQTITVSMKQSDFSEFGDVDFAWQVTGVRDGFENMEVIIDVDDNGNPKEKTIDSPKRKEIEKRAKKMYEKRDKAIGKRR